MARNGLSYRDLMGPTLVVTSPSNTTRWIAQLLVRRMSHISGLLGKAVACVIAMTRHSREGGRLRIFTPLAGPRKATNGGQNTCDALHVCTENMRVYLICDIGRQSPSLVQA